jgi:pyrroline-5-carboxylate reductase
MEQAQDRARARRVAMLGAGRMGQAVLAGLLGAGRDADSVVAAEPHGPTAETVRQTYGIEVLDGAAAAVSGADLVIVAVKPHQVLGLLDEVGPRLADGAVVLSIAAGLSTRQLAAHLPDTVSVVRVMPNTPALVGAGMSVLSPAAGTDAEAVAVARSVMSTVGEVREIPESLQDAATAVHGSGPAYLFYVVEAMIDAGVLLGLPRPLATDLAVQTIVGAGRMLAETGEHPGVLRENVTSPGGTTAAALHELDAGAVKADFARAMRACAIRAAELGG